MKTITCWSVCQLLSIVSIEKFGSPWGEGGRGFAQILHKHRSLGSMANKEYSESIFYTNHCLCMSTKSSIKDTVNSFFVGVFAKRLKKADESLLALPHKQSVGICGMGSAPSKSSS